MLSWDIRIVCAGGLDQTIEESTQVVNNMGAEIQVFRDNQYSDSALTQAYIKSKMALTNVLKARSEAAKALDDAELAQRLKNLSSTQHAEKEAQGYIKTAQVKYGAASNLAKTLTAHVQELQKEYDRVCKKIPKDKLQIMKLQAMPDTRCNSPESAVQSSYEKASQSIAKNLTLAGQYGTSSSQELETSKVLLGVHQDTLNTMKKKFDDIKADLEIQQRFFQLSEDASTQREITTQKAQLKLYCSKILALESDVQKSTSKFQSLMYSNVTNKTAVGSDSSLSATRSNGAAQGSGRGAASTGGVGSTTRSSNIGKGSTHAK